MTEPFDQVVNRFKTYFEEQLQGISQIQSHGTSVLHYKRILYVTVLDAIASVAFPNLGNRQRMVNLLSNFSDWKEYDRVSLPHLIRFLELVSVPDFKQLRLFANNKLNNWMPGDVVTLRHDPTFEEVEKFWPKNFKDENVLVGINKKFSLRHLQHVNLFYNHRNSLVHEFRMLGFLSSAPTHSKDEPYYSTLSFYVDGENDEEKSSWELLYPITFYEKISKNCLGNVSDYLIKNQINPLSFLISGSFWINELNI